MSDAVVIGGGVIGCSCAYNLARRGVRTILLERDRVGAHASGGAAGMLVPLAEARGRMSFFQLCRESLRMFPNLAADLLDASGIDIELVCSGTVYTAETPSQAEELHSWNELARLNALSVEWLSAQSLRSVEPAIAEDIQGCLFSSNEYQVRSLQLTLGLSRSAARFGAQIIEGVQVMDIGMNEGGCRVVTNDDTISCGAVIIASGPWTSNVPGDKWHLPIGPVKGQLLTLRPREESIRHTIYSPGGYLVPKNDGTVIVGATEEDAGFDSRPTAQACSDLLTMATRIAPSMSNSEVIGAWAGLRPATPDHLPVIGSLCGNDRIIVASGHYRNGVLLSPITGKLIADLVTEQIEPPHEFQPKRFHKHANSLIIPSGE